MRDKWKGEERELMERKKRVTGKKQGKGGKISGCGK